ncbi:unnamed protein product [Macrosiphum euphorbiae]|uniref:Uncharacterized protein n=1 Tax=Macrosiphum euphorbiae TaxID=13131 RepID=A0AAV0WYE9_9HEMI|nr:unnamed protein product [Macrosiphum euphorbiae]
MQRRKLKLNYNTEINIEKKDGFVFEGSVKNEFHSLELITQINSNKSSNLRSNSKVLFARNPKFHTSKRKKLFICDSCENVHYTKSKLITQRLCQTIERFLFDCHINSEKNATGWENTSKET